MFILNDEITNDSQRQSEDDSLPQNTDFAREQNFKALIRNSANKPQRGQKFKVLFQVPFETKLGESIAVVGSIKELGRWKDVKVNLTWTEGHVWKLLKPLEMSEQIFMYKYALIQDGKIKKLESGIDRLVDCCLKWEVTSLSGNSNVSHEQLENEKRGITQMIDTWEQMTIKFSIYTAKNDN